MNAVDRAREVGTLGAVDRSRQYTTPSAPELLRSLNTAWEKIRKLETASTDKDADILRLHKRLSNYKFLNIALTSILTGLAWEGLKLIVPAALCYLGLN